MRPRNFVTLNWFLLGLLGFTSTVDSFTSFPPIVGSHRPFPLPTAARAPSSSSPATIRQTTTLHVFERISEEGISALVAAQSVATKYQLEKVTIPCVLQGLTQFPSATTARTLHQGRYRMTLRRIETAIAALYVGTDDRSAGWLAGLRAAAANEDRPFATPVQQALERAGTIADSLQTPVVETHHLWLSVLEYDPQEKTANEESEAWQFLVQKLNVLDNTTTALEVSQALLEQHAKTGELVTGIAESNTKSPTLDSVGVNLSQQAADGLLDPVFGRDDEIKSCLRTLLRRRKNCVCLVGDAGVGKTAIAEGVAQALPSCRPLAEYRLVSVELASLVAGTRYRGDFEERLQSIVKEATDPASPPTILFLDEIHNLVGAGATEGGMDAANLLKPALARGQLQVIGATTVTEYRQYIEKDAALERRLQPVFVKEPSVPATLDILKAVQPNYEEHHRVKYTEAALAAAAELSERYISDRFLPDKALDLLDEAGASVVLNSMSSDAPSSDDDENSLIVTEETIASILSEMSGIPLGKLQSSERDRLQELESDMEVRVKGQGRAVRGVARAIRRARSGLRDPRRPVASFLFCGPTGTGKTELCKTLAETYYGSEKDMIRVDMSEYMEKFAVSRLTGPPPGYVGYEEGGQLTEAVRRAPHSVVLLDEIEKAHEDVLNILLQIMEDGMLTDGKGRTVNFKNCVLVMTSNVGSRRILDVFRGAKTPSSDGVSTVVNDGQPQLEPLQPEEILEKMQKNPKVGSLLMKASTDPTIMEAIRTAMSGSPADLKRAAQQNPDVAEFLQQVWDELSGQQQQQQEGATQPSSGLDIMRGSLKDTMAQWDESGVADFVEGVAEQIDGTTGDNSQYSELSEVVKEELEAAMKPELLNRIDEIVIFSPLTKRDLFGIAARNIGIITDRANEEHGLELEVLENLIGKVVDEGSENVDQFGARPMRRAAQRFIEDSISEAIIQGFLPPGSKATLSLSPVASIGGREFVRIARGEETLDVIIEDASGGIGSTGLQRAKVPTTNGSQESMQTETTR